MKNIRTIIILHFAFLIFNSSNAQTLSPKATPSAGGYFTGGGNSLSWTMGEPFYKTLQGGNILLTQGFQQTYVTLRILNLKAYLEGLYLGGGQMTALLYNRYPLVYTSNTSDSITVKIRASSPPYNVVASVNTLIHTNGTAVVLLPASVLNISYFITVHHRNSLETWSKVPVLFNTSTVSFDFTSP